MNKMHQCKPSFYKKVTRIIFNYNNNDKNKQENDDKNEQENDDKNEQENDDKNEQENNDKNKQENNRGEESIEKRVGESISLFLYKIRMENEKLKIVLDLGDELLNYI